MMNNYDGPAVAISGLQVVRGRRDVIPGLDLEIPAGEVIGLLGPSGSGKSTLMRCMVGVQIVKGGTVTVLGHPAGSPELREEVGYVTQTPSVYDDLTVRDNIGYFARAVGLRGTDAARRRRAHPRRGRPRLARRRARRATSPAGRSPGSRWQRPSSGDPPSSSSTSRPSASTPCSAATCGSSSAALRGKAIRSSSRATSWTRRRAATGSCCSARVRCSPTSPQPSCSNAPAQVDADAAFLALIEAGATVNGSAS